MEDEAKEEHFKEQDAAAKRFRYLLQHLWRWDRSKMARDLGILRGVVTQIARGDTGPAASTMRKLAEDPRVNAEWVMTGEGVPLKEQEAEAGEQQELIAALKDIAKAIREHTAATVQGQEAEPFSICYEKE
jgi:transcriptional regulator with XRE-family HTH domain